MAKLTGFIWLSGDDEYREHALYRGSFTIAKSASEIKKGPQIAGLSFDGETISAFAVAQRTSRGVTFRWNVRFSHIAECNPVVITELAERLDARTARAVIKGGQLTELQTEKLRAALTKNYPSAASAWEEAERRGVVDAPNLWDADGEPVVAYERDAVGVALQAAGIDRRAVLEAWDGDRAEPFMRGLEQFKSYEDSAINYDAQVFGDWSNVGASPIGMARFVHRDKRLTIINANRLAIEHALGCDLVYYTSDYDAYVLIQYKRLKQESADWVFRPERKFDDELKRMREIAAPGADDTAPEAHRLGDNFCFVKFCKAAVSNPYSGKLAPGFYLPLDYLDKLENAGRLKGKRDGRVISYDTCRRWLTNDPMTALIQDAWVGTRGMSTKAVEEVIRRSIDAGHSVVAAHAETIDPSTGAAAQSS